MTILQPPYSYPSTPFCYILKMSFIKAFLKYLYLNILKKSFIKMFLNHLYAFKICFISSLLFPPCFSICKKEVASSIIQLKCNFTVTSRIFNFPTLGPVTFGKFNCLTFEIPLHYQGHKDHQNSESS